MPTKGLRKRLDGRRTIHGRKHEKVRGFPTVSGPARTHFCLAVLSGLFAAAAILNRSLDLRVHQGNRLLDGALYTEVAGI